MSKLALHPSFRISARGFVQGSEGGYHAEAVALLPGESGGQASRGSKLLR